MTTAGQQSLTIYGVGFGLSLPVLRNAAKVGGGEYFEATDAEYVFNWGTAKNGAGFYHRVGVTLDDGQTYHVNIGLR